MNKYVKLLVESLFDDDIFNDDEADGGIGEMLQQEFYDICKNSLCISSQYHFIMPEDKDDGLTSVKEDPDNPGILYAGLMYTYKSLNLGPRKRKKYTIDYFYRYKILFNDDGTISLYIKHFNGNDYCIFNEQLVKFVEDNSYYRLKDIYFMNGKTANSLCSKFQKIFIIPANNKISDKFIQHFPDDILPHANEDVQEDLSKPSTFYKSSFTSDEMFFTLIKKLVEQGYYIKDKEGTLYTKSNIDEIAQDILSGAHEEKLAQIEQEHLNFVTNKLGQIYIDKLNEIIKYYKSQNKNMYLKTINTLRTDRINLATTVQNLRIDNDCITAIEQDSTDYYNNYPYKDDNIDYLILRMILYKMFYILKIENLWSFTSEYDLTDCIDGIEYQYSYYGGYSTKNLDLNDLPIKITGAYDLYKLYYVIAKAIVQCKDLKDFDKNNKDLRQVDLEKLNKNKTVNLETFNFDYLTKQLKVVIDKTCKKLKIKIK